eukprot:6602419-Prymnesium_polylepis.3
MNRYPIASVRRHTTSARRIARIGIFEVVPVVVGIKLSSVALASCVRSHRLQLRSRHPVRRPVHEINGERYHGMVGRQYVRGAACHENDEHWARQVCRAPATLLGSLGSSHRERQGTP